MHLVANKPLILMQKVTLWKKIYVIYNFFLVRKIIGHIVTFVFYCLVVPATVLIPEVEIPRWGYVYLPSIVTILNSIGTPRCQIFSIALQFYFQNMNPTYSTQPTVLLPELCSSEQPKNLHENMQWCRSLHLLIFWVLFENVMSLHRTKATLIGLLETGRVNEWVVTEKLGDALKLKLPGKAFRRPRMRIGDRYAVETF